MNNGGMVIAANNRLKDTMSVTAEKVYQQYGAQFKTKYIEATKHVSSDGTDRMG